MVFKLRSLLVYDLVDISTEVLDLVVATNKQAISQLGMRPICQLILRAHQSQTSGQLFYGTIWYSNSVSIEVHTCTFSFLILLH